jgi:hypothetical protein
MKVTTVGLDLAKSVLQVHGAVAHRLLMLSYHLLSRRVAYTELGTDYVDRQQVERQRGRLMRIGRGLRERVPLIRRNPTSASRPSPTYATAIVSFWTSNPTKSVLSRSSQ